MEISVKQLTLFPWDLFLAEAGSPLAFPYGYVMWVILLPLTILCKFLEINVYWGYGVTLLLTDITLLHLLHFLIPITNRSLLIAYWLSPIVLFATYWLGLNDLIPVTLPCLALLSMRRLHSSAAGIFCGAATSAKLSMVLVYPFS